MVTRRFSLRTIYLLLLVALVSCRCSQRQHASRDAPSSSEERDAAFDDAMLDGGPSAAADAGEGVDETAPLDAGLDDFGADTEAAGESEPPPGELISKATVGDGGAEVRVEAMDGGFGFRLQAAEDEPLSVEPLAQLEGPMRIGFYFGPRCQRATKGEGRFLGRWAGSATRCVTEPQPMAILDGRSPGTNCPVERATPGDYELSFYRCGRYSEPLVKVGFEVPRPAESAADGGAGVAEADGGATSPDADIEVD